MKITEIITKRIRRYDDYRNPNKQQEMQGNYQGGGILLPTPVNAKQRLRMLQIKHIMRPLTPEST